MDLDPQGGEKLRVRRRLYDLLGRPEAFGFQAAGDLPQGQPLGDGEAVALHVAGDQPIKHGAGGSGNGEAVFPRLGAPDIAAQVGQQLELAGIGDHPGSLQIFSHLLERCPGRHRHHHGRGRSKGTVEEQAEGDGVPGRQQKRRNKEKIEGGALDHRRQNR